MKKRLILKVLGLLLLLPMFSGCNDTDDVAGIFTGKTWKLTYITKANGHGWYKFADVDDSNIMEYADGKKTFMLVFSGTVEDDIIQGTFTGQRRNQRQRNLECERQKPGIRDESGKGNSHRQQRPHRRKDTGRHEKSKFLQRIGQPEPISLLPD